MKHRFLFIITVFLALDISAQILDINQPLFSEVPFFNAEFIKANKIKSITGSISSKKVRDIIRSKGLDYRYEFNSKGQLQMQLSSHFTEGIKDSSTIAYEYDDDGKIILKRNSDGKGYYSYHYNYDSLNNIISQTYYRDESKNESKNKFELKKEYLIVSDSFSYQKTDPSQTKKIFYNGYKKAYKEQTKYYDNMGYLVEEYTKFIIGNNKKKITYEYNEKGQIFKKHVYTNLAEGKKTTEEYSYDEIGNILEIKIFDDEKYITSKQFLYDAKTMLLSAQIIQDIETQFLRIIKYNYTFFDNSTAITQMKLPADTSDTNGTK